MKRKLLAVLGLLSIVLVLVIKPYYQFLTDTLHISPFMALISNGDLKTFDNRVNILILGKPGGSHDGPNLTDSITILSYNLKTKSIVTIGIPRDFWSGTLEDKINTAYAYGEAKQQGGGIKLAKAEVAGIIGMPVHYAVVISFDKFAQLIDYLGGIDIVVERSFTDQKFPVPGRENDECNGDEEYHCRYQTLSFQKGPTHMDGKTALMFVRSRHAEGVEGSDFARSKRQQLVMNALQESIIKKLKTPRASTLKELYGAIDPLIERDITNQQAAVLVRSVVTGGSLEQQRFALPEDLFIIPPADEYNGKYVLIPQGGSAELVPSYIECLLTTGSADSCEHLYEQF